MDVSYPPESAAFRAEVQAFLREVLPADWAGIGALEGQEYWDFVDHWRRTLHERGFLAVDWPKEYGGPGLSPLEQVILAEEFARAGVPHGGVSDGFGIGMLGNTLLRWGTEEQKRYYLPRILSNEDTWCQGYSEPDAGSDLANLSTRAVLDGDEWVINGQKVWTTWGHRANNIFVLCRTNPTAPKHRGLSLLLCSMDQPGIEVRPITQITGEADFNEVFFTDARCPKANVVGEVDNGWAVAMTLLGYERGEAAAVLPIKFRQSLDRLVALAQERGRADDPVIRQRLAWCHSKVEIMRFLGYRTLTTWLQGGHPGPDASIFKTVWSEYQCAETELALDILGADATVPTGRWPINAFQADDVGAPNASASWAGMFLSARSGTIYAGSAEIQRNILGEMVLGLPKEPKVEQGASK